MNLRTIPHLTQAFDVPVGLSDHTLGIAVPVAAVALGACIIEKHFTLSREVAGPDSAFSLEPHEFKEMVDAVRGAEKALGGVRYEVTEREKESRVFRRSVFVVEDVAEGERRVMRTNLLWEESQAPGLSIRGTPGELQMAGRFYDCCHFWAVILYSYQYP